MSKIYYKNRKVSNNFLQILFICSNEYQYFLDKANVVGVGLGYKVIKGECTFESCIKVFVIKKINSKILKNDLIPSLYKGIKTDVVESGLIKASSFTKKVRPAIGGYIIGPENVSNNGGTLGCLVKDKLGMYILSNNHIMANENRLPLGTSILQPSVEFGGKSRVDEIARLSSYIPLKFQTSKYTPDNYVDCAIAKVINESMVSPKIASIGYINGISDSILNQKVQKVGSITELTFGVVTAIGSTFEVGYDCGKVLFKDQVVTTKMSKHGDSGAILLNENKYALGLLIGTGTSVTVFNSIKRVLNSFKVSIMTN